MSTNNLRHVEQLFDKIFENFNCCICLGVIKNTVITSCGHRFCEDCLKEVISVYKKCSICNRQLSENDFIRDVTFDALIEEMSSLKEKEMQTAVTKMIESVRDQNSVDYDLKSPLHQVLKNHLVKSLMMHENYLKQMKKDYLNQIKLIDDRTAEQLNQIQNTGQEAESRFQELTEQAKSEKVVLKNEFETKIESIAAKYSNYLDQTGITPLNLPVQIRLRIVPFKGGHRKDMRLNGPELKPYQDYFKCYSNWSSNLIALASELDSKSDPKASLQETTQVTKQGDRITNVPNDLVVVNLGPFSKYTNEETMRICENFIRTKSLPEFVDVLRERNRLNSHPIQEFFIKPDSEIVFYGDFKFESDQPKRCFKNAFDKNRPQPVDYFKCQNCNQNWICKNCKETCHSDHQVTLFSKNHQATWACCNCHKTGSCCLEEG